jgi:hypothetical protein
MARTVAGLSEGTRVTDYISLGVVAKTFPLDQVQIILRETGRESIRQRQLPAHVVFYYVIALALFSQVSYGRVLAGGVYVRDFCETPLRKTLARDPCARVVASKGPPSLRGKSMSTKKTFTSAFWGLLISANGSRHLQPDSRGDHLPGEPGAAPG